MLFLGQTVKAIPLPSYLLIHCFLLLVGSVPPISSLRLLVPPLRLMSAFMWKIAQQQHLEHYGKLEEFVSLVTRLVPEVLTSRQKATLVMGLRAKVSREGDGKSRDYCTETDKANLWYLRRDWCSACWFFFFFLRWFLRCAEVNYQQTLRRWSHIYRGFSLLIHQR